MWVNVAFHPFFGLRKKVEHRLVLHETVLFHRLDMIVLHCFILSLCIHFYIGYEDIVQQLFEKGANIKRDGFSALLLAAKRGKLSSLTVSCLFIFHTFTYYIL